MRRLGDTASRRRGSRDWEGRWRVFAGPRRRGLASAVLVREEMEGAPWGERWSGEAACCQTYCWLWWRVRAATVLYDVSVDEPQMLLRGGRRRFFCFSASPGLHDVARMTEVAAGVVDKTLLLFVVCGERNPGSAGAARPLRGPGALWCGSKRQSSASCGFLQTGTGSRGVCLARFVEPGGMSLRCDILAKVRRRV